MTQDDGQFYRCSCPSCSAEFYDALPPKCCWRCGSSDLAVSFDRLKRAAYLAQSLPYTRIAAQIAEPVPATPADPAPPDRETAAADDQVERGEVEQ